MKQNRKSPLHAEEPSLPLCSACSGRLLPTEVESRLYVRRRGDTSGDAWSTTQLESWTCHDCGRTDLYATEPHRLDA